MKISIKIGDIFVYAFAVVLIIISLTGMYLMGLNNDKRSVVIEVDKSDSYSIEIREGMEPVELRVDAGGGRYNTVVITYEEVRIEEANCPDQLCVKTGAIRSPGQAIVCLPHKVTVTITGVDERQSDIDDIAH
ncbi:MAG: NusG domain II-containing protein [Clostridiales bacterium]|jgi:hypothetical protein|nr:NusG domain II-containing protein [Clostridiales bacterium]